MFDHKTPDDKYIKKVVESLLELCKAEEERLAQAAFGKLARMAINDPAYPEIKNLHPVLNQYIDASEGQGISKLASFKSSKGKNKILIGKLLETAMDPSNDSIAFTHGNPYKMEDYSQKQASFEAYRDLYMRYNIFLPSYADHCDRKAIPEFYKAMEAIQFLHDLITLLERKGNNILQFKNMFDACDTRIISQLDVQFVTDVILNLGDKKLTALLSEHENEKAAGELKRNPFKSS